MSGIPVQGLCSAAQFEHWLDQNTSMSETNRHSLADVLAALRQRFSGDHKSAIGISGAPGCGKSTLSRALVHGLQRDGIPACRLALDDYYLGRRERERLAERVHPLMRERGVPGTHDLDLLVSDFDRLWSGREDRVRLPVFDKSTDDRAPENRWRLVDGSPQVLLVEGWCIGAPPAKPVPPQPEGRESLYAPAQRWTDHVQRAWLNMHEALGHRLQQLWYIRVPDWNCVIDWRWQQERELKEPRLQSRPDVERFLTGFRDISRRMLESHDRWADLVLPVDRDHNYLRPEPTTKQP
jgi:D-glycerate 3-kinase